MDLSYYSGKKVFLTGHTGFKGSWMLSWLNLLGARVKGYSLAPQFDYELYNQINGERLCESVIADIRDKERLELEVLAFEPDFIFHLAAQPLVRYSYEIPAQTFETNVLGTVYLLDAARKLEKACQVVVITTDKVYENLEWNYPYRETDHLGGYDPYSASKASVEIVVNSYRDSFFNTKDFAHHKKAIATARAGNVIGGGDWAKDRIVPDIIRSFRTNQPVVIRNPKAVRPWQHVLEPLAGYLQLGIRLVEQPLKFSGPWNFGPFNHDNLTVEKLVTIAIEKWGSGSMKLNSLDSQPHEAGLLRLDISKAVAELQWVPKMDAYQSIAMTVLWYKSAEENVARKLVENDIKAYSEIILS